MTERIVFYVDPMSYNNLSLYDKSLIENLLSTKIYFFGNVKYEYLNNSRFKLFLIYNYSDKKGFNKLLSYLNSNLKLIIYVIRYRPHVIHFQWFKVPVLDVLFLMLIKICHKNINIVFTAHNLLPHGTGDKYYSKYKKIYEIVNKIIVHDITTKNQIASRFNIKFDKIYVIPHGILDFKEISNKIVKTTEYDITFSFLGHLSYYKGIDILIDAWNLYMELHKNTRIKLIIAGKVSNENIQIKLRKLLCHKNVEIVQRFLSTEEFKYYLLMSDVVLLPYREISQSGLLLTAMAYRKAVIVSNKGGLTQPFLIGKVGWILSELTAEELKNTIEYVTINRKELVQIESNDKLWNEIHNYYSWNNIANQTIKVYNS